MRTANSAKSSHWAKFARRTMRTKISANSFFFEIVEQGQHYTVANTVRCTLILPKQKNYVRELSFEIDLSELSLIGSQTYEVVIYFISFDKRFHR